MPLCLQACVTWIDTGEGEEEGNGTSFMNRHEVDRIMWLLSEIASDGERVRELADDADRQKLPAAVGIIAAYKAQAEAIEERIWASSLPKAFLEICKVGTVDSYEGKENPIIIFGSSGFIMGEG